MSRSVTPSDGEKRILILGTRGVPAAHGGFETFAEKLALWLVARGWRVTVYCQEDGGEKIFGTPREDYWQGVRRIHISTSAKGPVSTMAFDWACISHAMKEPGVPLVLGYNTAFFAARLHRHGRAMLMNMDGIEWKRAKWGGGAKVWFYLNEWFGARCATKLVADHPRIADHLARRRKREDIVTIAYGADPVTAFDDAPVRAMGLTPGQYFISIGRVEPENSTLELVRAFASEKRQTKYVCLGKLEPEKNPYHREILRAGQDRVVFPGAIYDQNIVKALRFHALAYFHGHTVGGTNPSLVEAIGAGSAIIAHDNEFNRWVVGEGHGFFKNEAELAACIARAERDPDWVTASKAASKARFDAHFTWDMILSQYEQMLEPYSR